MPLGLPAVTKPRQLQLRDVQDAIDRIRQRLASCDAEILRLSAVADASSAASQIAALQSTVRQLTTRVTALESALGVTDTVVIPAAVAVTIYDPVVMYSATSCGPVDVNDPTRVHALIGLAKNTAGVGQPVTIQRRGSLTITGAAFDANRPVYAGLVGLTQSPNYSEFVLPVGLATSTDTLWVAPGAPALLEPGNYPDPFEDWLPPAWGLVRDRLAPVDELLQLGDGYVFSYQGLLTVISGSPGGGASTLAALTDVNVAGASAGNLLQLIGGYWTAVSLGVNFTASTTAPTDPVPGDRWFKTDEGILYTYVDDGSSSQWVEL